MNDAIGKGGVGMNDGMTLREYLLAEFELDLTCLACVAPGVKCDDHARLTIDEMKWSAEGRLVAK